MGLILCTETGERARVGSPDEHHAEEQETSKRQASSDGHLTYA
jgi:hypothetical protein